MDSFTVAVLVGVAFVLGLFVVMFVLDKGKEKSTGASTSGKR